MNILVLNPGGNSLKIDAIACGQDQRYAFEATKLLSVNIEGSGKEPKLSQLEEKKSVHSEPIEAEDYTSATESFLNWYEQAGDERPKLTQIGRAAIRVVHGGREFGAPTLIDQTVEKKVMAFEKLAPLHNKSSVEVLVALRRRLPNVPIYGVFDTAFHRTIPEHAWRYALPRTWQTDIRLCATGSTVSLIVTCSSATPTSWESRPQNAMLYLCI